MSRKPTAKAQAVSFPSEDWPLTTVYWANAMSSSRRQACLEPSQTHRLLIAFPWNLSRSWEWDFYQAPGPMAGLSHMPSYKGDCSELWNWDVQKQMHAVKCLRDTEYRDLMGGEENLVQNRLHHAISFLVLLGVTKCHKLSSFKQCKCILFQFWKSQGPNQSQWTEGKVSAEMVPPRGFLLGQTLFPCPSHS